MADASKKKLLKLRKVFDDEDQFDLAAVQGGYYVPHLGANLSAAWGVLEQFKMDAIANGAQTSLAPGFWFLAQVIPQATGYSMFILPKSNYGSYAIPLYDNTYPQNPKSVPNGDWGAAINQNGKFEGFKAHGWTCTKKVTDPDTLETTDKPVQCNDNTIIYNIITYNKDTDKKTKDNMGTMKFDFAMNQYKANRADFKGDQMWVSAQGNNENIMIFKQPMGIIGFNWPTLEYKGNRTPVGSISNGISDCISFVNELIEKEMLDGEKW